MAVPNLVEDIDWNALVARVAALESGLGHPKVYSCNMEPQNGATWNLEAARYGVRLDAASEDCYLNAILLQGHSTYTVRLHYGCSANRATTVTLRQMNGSGSSQTDINASTITFTTTTGTGYFWEFTTFNINWSNSPIAVSMQIQKDGTGILDIFGASIEVT
jgi:hypothetical protein